MHLNKQDIDSNKLLEISYNNFQITDMCNALEHFLLKFGAHDDHSMLSRFLLPTASDR